MSYTPLDSVAKEATLNVPAQNSASNTNMSQVVGNKTDDEAGTSLMSRLYIISQHIHSAAKLYPTLANATTITKVNATAWGLGALPTQIIPAGTILVPFDIHFINIGTISGNDEYEVHLFKGAAASEIEIARVSFDRTATLSEGSCPCQTELLPANTRISAKLTSANNSSRNITVKLYYHEY